tara:strand:- start:528 stop:677 length:150 start_codon:yes stop_codon:yes gene_type:complete
MTENAPENETTQPPPSHDDSKVDAVAIAVIFVAAVLMAAHLISGFTFDL